MATTETIADATGLAAQLAELEAIEDNVETLRDEVATLVASVSDIEPFRTLYGVDPDAVEAVGMSGYTINDSNGDWDAGGPLYFDAGNLTGDITLDAASTNIDGLSHLCFMAKYEAAVGVDFDITWTVTFKNSLGATLSTTTWTRYPGNGYYVYDENGAGSETNQLLWKAEKVAIPTNTDEIVIAGTCQTSGTSRAVSGAISIGPGPFFS